MAISDIEELGHRFVGNVTQHSSRTPAAPTPAPAPAPAPGLVPPAIVLPRVSSVMEPRRLIRLAAAGHGSSYRQRHLLRTAYFARGWRLIDRPKPSTCSYLPCSYLTIRLPPRCSGCLLLFQDSMSTCPIKLCSTVCCAVQQ